MKNSLRILAIVLALLVVFAFSATAFAETAPVYADEFNAFDATTWAKTTPWGSKYTTGELEYYDPADTVAANGMLRITSEHRAMNGYNYTSGIITSLNRTKFQYGYFEMRAKLPKGQGIWPAFWLTNDNNSEIDIFEMLGNEPTRLYYTLHHTHDGTKHAHGFTTVGPDYSQGFHTFAVDWQPTYLKWYVDGVQVASYSDNIPSDPLWICANTAVGGAWPGSPDSTTVFPQYYDIDYIRVWRTKADAVASLPEAAPVANPDAYTTTVNTALAIAPTGVLANDTDVNLDPLTASLVTPPSHGVLGFGADGSLTYTPAGGFTGTDSFAYQASDGKMTSPATVVTIAVKSDKPSVRKGRKNTLTVAGAVPDAIQAVSVVVQSQRLVNHKWRTYRVLARRTIGSARYYIRTRAVPKGTYRIRVVHYGGGTSTRATSWVKVRK